MKKVNNICELAKEVLSCGGKEGCQYVSHKAAVIMELCYFDTEFELRVEDLRKGFDYKKEVVKVFSVSDRIEASNWLAEYYGDC